MSSITSPEQDPKVEKILDAAKQAFMERGYAETSMDLVARRASASKTTLYTRFPSKEALFAATIERECCRRGVLDELEQVQGRSIAEALFCFGHRFLDLLASPEAVRVQQIVSGEAARFPELALLYFQNGPLRTIEAAERLFAAAARDGRLRSDDPAFMARQFLGMLKGFVDCEVLTGSDETLFDGPARDDYLRRAIILFLEGAAPR